MGRPLTVAAALVASGSLALAVTAGASGTPAHHGATVAAKKRAVKKTVRIHDNYYTPTKLSVRRNTTIVWKWPTTTGDTHDVNLGKRPKGVKKFHSQLVATDYTFRRKLVKPGLYHIYCSIHANMKMTIRVKR
jgi:plastocyanin